MRKIVLFNFNGTLVDTKSLSIRIFNEIAQDRGYKPISEQNVHHLSTLSVRKRCKMLGVPIYLIPFVGLSIKRRYQKYIPDLAAVSEVSEVLGKLKNQGFRLGLITTNSPEVTSEFLSKNEIDIFDYAYYPYNPFSKSKNLAAFLRKFGIDNREVIYIGDEIRDIKASKKVHMKSIAAAWGYDSVELLKKGHPDYIAQHPSDIVQIVSGG